MSKAARPPLVVCSFVPVLALLLVAIAPVPRNLAAQAPARAPAAVLPPRDTAAASALIADAKAFMAAYAEELRRGDREAIIARYDATGNYVAGSGIARFEPHDSIASTYRNRWGPPERFEWHDMQYEVVGPDAVIAVGTFTWDDPGIMPATQMSYVGLLRRQPDGTLRIRVEDESGLPPLSVVGVLAGVLVMLGASIGWFAGRRRGRRQGMRLAQLGGP